MFEQDILSVFDKTKDKNSDSSIKKIENQSGDGFANEVSNKRYADETDREPSKKMKFSDDDSFASNVPRIQIHQLETLEACTHEVALPPGSENLPLTIDPNSKPAKEYPFILDPFQKQAILCIENNQSVLVSAHTSAGKTVVAEYAVALSLRRKQRVIYTTPIKALSNQKYREFSDEFKDVGLMTGDVTINPDASCLIMTTEILRSMLYRGSEVIREVAWVIFDEIHYMRNKERGVVWEESIILLPDNVHHVFLSATIPNARQFAEWICYLHKQPCHVVYTEYRPTPLQHYIFPANGDGIHLVVDENGSFREENFHTAMTMLEDAGKVDQKGRKGGTKGESSCFKIVKMIMERNYVPVIIFSFSRKDCEAYARQLSKLDFNSEKEKKWVELVYNNAIDTLCDEDKKLPQVEQVLPLLMKGIGIHHSGLLPIIKEIIEILFAEGFIKALCATETFAMGLNMPAHTVLFTSARKFDGKDFRWISSGEYIQMSGRAGRRGLDEKGIVILMLDEKMSHTTAKQIVMGKPDPLNSAFHLTYNMILNMLRVEGINPEYMLEKSFYQFQNYEAIPDKLERLKDAEKKYSSITFANEGEMMNYSQLKKQLDSCTTKMLSTIQKPQYILPFLSPGRLVKVVSDDLDFGWGVVVNFRKKANQNMKTGLGSSEIGYFAEVILNLEKTSAKTGNVNDIRPSPLNEVGEAQIVPVQFSVLVAFSTIRAYLPADLIHPDTRKAVIGSIKNIQSKFPDGVPLLDPIEDIGIKEDNFLLLAKRVKELQEKMKPYAQNDQETFANAYAQFEEREKICEEIKGLKAELRQKKSLLQMEELKKRKRVLRILGYVDSLDVIQLKGRVACEISGTDELVISELLFNGVFNKLSTEETCAILSCFVFQDKSSEMVKLNEAMTSALKQLQDAAHRIAEISKGARMDLDEDSYVESFKPGLMNVVYAWSKGSSFSQICQLTTVFEGSVIRCMRRLEECLRQVLQATRTIGNAELEEKFEKGIQLIKRNIIFAASLYL